MTDSEQGGTAPVCDAAADILRPRLKDLSQAVRRFKKAHDEHASAEDLANSVHKVRVSARRANVTLDALRSCSEPQAWKQLRRSVKRIRRASGVIRDADVHMGLLNDLGGREETRQLAGLKYLCARVVKDREAGLDHLWTVLKSNSARRLRDQARDLTELTRPSDSIAETFDALAAQELEHLASQVVTLGEEDVARPECLHEFRLAVKRLRYGLEVFGDSVADAVRTPIAATLEEAQKIAGEANDLMTMVARLDLYIAELSEQRTPDTGLVAALAGLRARFSAVAELRRRKVADWWRGVDARAMLTPLTLGDVRALQPNGKPADEDQRGKDPMTMREITPAQRNGPPANGIARTAAPSQRNLWLSGRRLAVIDIGSNSIRLLAVELIDERSWKTLAEERAMTRLAQGMGKSGLISPESMARSVEAVGRFKAIAEKLGVTNVRAFATAAAREAKNKNDFVSLVQDRTGLKLELVSALDEGKLTHRSVARVYDLSHGMAAVVDIGGGSMEVVFSQNGVITENSSMPLGAVRVTELFGGADAASGPNFKRLRRYVEDSIEDHVREHETAPTIVVGCGGTFTTLLTLAAASRGVMIDRNSSALSTLGPVARPQLKNILKELRGMTLEQRLRVPGLPSDRADIVVAGFAAIERLLKHLGASQVHVHPGGFREGLVLRLIDHEIAERTSRGPEPHDVELVQSARDLAVRCSYERPHSEQVVRLSLSLFDQFKDESNLIPGLGTIKHERAILEAAAVLHDVGIMVEYPRHHKHSQTIIRHADLPGWDPRQIELIATIARYHRRSVPTPAHPEFAALSEPEQFLVRRLAGLLRVADGLDRAHAQAVESVRVRFGNKAVHLGIRASADVTTDLKAANEKSDLLTAILGVKVTLGVEASKVSSPAPQALPVPV